jgi:hypothetical protein
MPDVGSGALSGASIGTAIAPGIGTAVGAGAGALIGALFSMGDSPSEEAYQQIFDMLKDYMPELKREAYTKNEIQTIVNSMKQMYRNAADVAAGKIGAAIGESGAAKGGGFADYYAQALAPVIAQGEAGAASAEQFGVEAYSTIKSQTNQNVIGGMNAMTNAAAGLPSMTSGQKGTAGFLQTLNLLSTAGGNYAQMYKNLNTKYPNPTAGG